MLAVEAVEVGERRVEALVRVLNPCSLTTAAWPGLADRVWSLLPGLARHTCDNDTGASFRQELRNTELAHCVEHVAAELMALSGSPRTLRGTTSWDFQADGAGVYRVTLEYDDDLVALGALGEAVRIVQWAANPAQQPPDIVATGCRLRALRATPGS